MSLAIPPPSNSGRGVIALAPLELLHAEFVAYLVRSHEAGRLAGEELHAKLEAAGFAVGRRYAERLALARDRPIEVLDVVKFVCREFWQEMHLKAVDKLQTNNKGVFVLQDFNYRWLRYVSAKAGGGGSGGGVVDASATSSSAAPVDSHNTHNTTSSFTSVTPTPLQYLVFPCGLIRGALSAFDVQAVVNADLSASPRTVFHIRVVNCGGGGATGSGGE